MKRRVTIMLVVLMTMVISTWAHGVNVVTMKSTTLPMADTMDEYRSSSKGCQGRLLLYDIAVR